MAIIDTMNVNPRINIDVSPAHPLVGDPFAISRTMMATAKVHSAVLNCLLMCRL